MWIWKLLAVLAVLSCRAAVSSAQNGTITPAPLPNVTNAEPTNSTGNFTTLPPNSNVTINGTTMNPNNTSNTTTPVMTTATVVTTPASTPPTGGGGGVPGWGIALLVLASLAVLLLLLLLIGLLVWWCCGKKKQHEYSPYDNMGYKNDIPLYTTHGNLSRNGGSHDIQSR